jgi:hypothetical protein
MRIDKTEQPRIVVPGVGLQLLLPSQQLTLTHRLHGIGKPRPGQSRVALPAQPTVLRQRRPLGDETAAPGLHPRAMAVASQLQPESEQPRRLIPDDHLCIDHDDHLNPR